MVLILLILAVWEIKRISDVGVSSISHTLSWNLNSRLTNLSTGSQRKWSTSSGIQIQVDKGKPNISAHFASYAAARQIPRCDKFNNEP